MRQRGYPVGDFDQQARDVSVDHAEVVHEYRAAHDISLLNDRQQATTEQLRQAMVHYRALFTELLGDDDVASAAPPVYPTDERDRGGRDLPDHDLSDRDVAYLERTDRETVTGGASYQDSTHRDSTRQDSTHRDSTHRDEAYREPTGRGLADRDATGSQEHRQAEERFAANHDGSYDDARGGTSSGGATDPGYATDEDRRRREGGLLGSGDREQPQVVHVRRERLDDGADDRDLPPRT
jgi:hypothetical protein